MADVFTKPLTAPLFLLQQRKLMVDSSLFRLREDVEEDKSKHTALKTNLIKHAVLLTETHRFKG